MTSASTIVYQAAETGDWDVAGVHGNLAGVHGTLADDEQMANYDRFWDEVYGDTPRRIGYASALLYGFGLPIMAGNTIYASAPAEDLDAFIGDIPWNHAYERGEVLAVGATRIGERTWLSLPLRAMLEIFGRTRNRSVTMSAVRFLYDFHFDPDEIAELADITGLTVGLRRMCSVADQLEKTAGRPAPSWVEGIREKDIVSTSDISELLDRKTKRTPYLHDSRWNIDWNAPPEELESYLIY